MFFLPNFIISLNYVSLTFFEFRITVVYDSQAKETDQL